LRPPPTDHDSLHISTLTGSPTGVGPVRAVGFRGDSDRGLYPRLFTSLPFREQANRPPRVQPRMWDMLSSNEEGWHRRRRRGVDEEMETV